MLNKDRKIINTTTHIRDSLKSHIREFVNAGHYDGTDSNLDPDSMWDKSSIRFLFCHLLPASEKVGGSVASVVEGTVISLLKSKLGESNVFVDTAYMCEKENATLYESLHLPVWFGTASHRSILEFDAILITNSTLEEKMNIPWLLHHSGIPIWMTQRLLPENSHIPLVLLGGNSSTTPDVLFGSSEDGLNRSWVDGVFVGHGEGIVGDIPQALLDTKGKPKSERLEYLFKFWNFCHPLAYDHIYKDSWRIDKTVKVMDKAPDCVHMNKREDINNFPGSQRYILHHGSQTSMLGTDVIVSWGCSSGGSCSFCQEGNASGGWRQKSLEKIKEEFINIRLSAMPESVNYLSFNINYYPQYMQLMSLGMSLFGRSDVQASRVDSIARRPEYFDLARKLNLQRMTFGFEGVSERLRNGYLNKWLAEEDFYKAWMAAASNRLMEIKLYCINTGLEEQEDFDDLIRVLTNCYKMRDDIGSKTSLRVSFTHLCGYPHTPLAWEPRRPLIESFCRRMPDLLNRIPEDGWKPKEESRFRYFIDKIKEMGVRFKFSSRGHITDLTQLTLDLGRKITPILTRASIEENMVYGIGMLTSEKMRWIIDQLYNININVMEVAQSKPYEHVFPDNYLYVVNREYLKACHRKAVKFIPVPFCLSTPARPYKDPVEDKVIAVSKIDDSCKDPRTCLACGYCDVYTKDPKLARRSRQVYSERKYDTSTSIDEVLVQVQLNKAHEKLFVRWTKNPEFGHLDPNTIWHFLWARMMTEVSKRYGVDEALKCKFIHEGSLRLCNKHNATDFCSGEFVSEVQLKEKFLFPLSELSGIFKSVSSNILASRFIDAKYVSIETSFPDDVFQIILFRSTTQNLGLKERILGFNGEVKILTKSIGGNSLPEFELKFIDLPQILFFDGTPKAGSYFLASIPGYVNPQMLVSSITGESYLNCCSKYTFHRFSYFKAGSKSCQNCHSSTYVDPFTGIDSNYCELCFRKTLLIRIQKFVNQGGVV